MGVVRVRHLDGQAWAESLKVARERSRHWAAILGGNFAMVGWWASLGTPGAQR